ncbi:Fur family transcriptional regulator [Desulfogranum japonicum]|uniref:Fur family transcriptional regulator n=1 Tax=Desulfogranum japonicum TaxID=231447 RepID=UPI00048BA6FF|nr:transcriptional repressor [Desulfogranum japonicum]
MKHTLRMTHQREIILAELRKSTSHPTADELYERIRKKLPRISLATVYRNLEILFEAGVISKVEISGRQKRFDYDLEEHDHIYCVKCHRVDNINLPKTQKIVVRQKEQKGYRISGCRIEFYGICPDCRKKQKKELEGDNKMGCSSCELSDKQKEVLEALAKSNDPCGSKDIASVTSLEPKQISCQITALKKKGYVASPVRCKYEITEEGKKALD